MPSNAGPDPGAGHGVSSYRRLSDVLVVFLVFLLVANFAVAGWNELAANNSSRSTDQGAYLRLAVKLREGEDFTDGNRHPLYPLLLVPFASRDWRFFTYSKMLSLAIAMVGLVIIFALTRRRYGLAVALAATLLVSLNAEYIRAAARVASEPLLVLLFFLAWYALLSGIDDWRMAWLGGAFAGLAYLTKATGQMLVLAFVVFAVLKWRRSVLRQRGLWAFLIAYLLVAAPLFAYNLREYDNPLYNFNTQNAMWMDSWSDRYEEGDYPTLSSYLQTHSAREMIRREWDGLIELRKPLGDALLPFGWTWEDSPLNHPAFWVLAALAAGLFLAWPPGRRRAIAYYRQRREMLWLTSVLFGLFYLSFAWYVPVASEGRFLLPLAPLIWICLADLAVQLARQPGLAPARSWSEQRTRRLATGGALVGLLALAGGLAAGVAMAWPPARDVFARDAAAEGRGQNTMEWLLAHMDPRERVIRGPTQRLPSWQYTGVFRFKTVPAGTMSWTRMAETMSEADANYFIVDVGVFRERHQLLSQFFEQVVDQEDRLRLRVLPPGWELAYAEPESPGDSTGLPRECAYCLLRKVDPPPGPPITLPQVDFGNRMRLLGYYLPTPAVRAGETLQVILYWQGLVQMHEDYAVAVRLVGDDGQVYAQQDGLTVEGRFVTTGWPPGDTVADLHEIAVPRETPAGLYRLEVGVYQPQTGERLEAGGPGAGSHGATIPGIVVKAAH